MASANLTVQTARPIERLALNKTEAAEALGVSRAWFVENVMPSLRVIRRGRRTLIPRAELERWLGESATRDLPWNGR